MIIWAAPWSASWAPGKAGDVHQPGSEGSRARGVIPPRAEEDWCLSSAKQSEKR